MQEIVNACHELLTSFPEAQTCRDYLNNRLSSESQHLFKFGYFPSGKSLSVLLERIKEEVLIENKLLYFKDIEDSLGPRHYHVSYFEQYPLIMPFTDLYGKEIALIGRTLLSEEERKKLGIPKYKNTIFNKGNYLFGLYQNKENIIKKNYVYLVEGQFDVIKAMEKGLDNVVALSNSHLTDYQFSVITRYTENLCFILDNDEAGEKGRKRIMEKYGKYAHIDNLYLPKNVKDIDEYLTENSLDNLIY